MYKLRIEKGPEEGKTLPIPEDGLALGRSSQNDVAIRDEMLSRRHCRFWFEDGAPFVADLATVNGTQVNGVSIQEATRLKPGDAVAIGVSVLRLSDENGEFTAPPAPSAVTATITSPAAAAPAPAPASNDGALNVSATVSGGTASVAPISSAAIASAVGSDGGNAGLTLDLTSLGADVSTVSVPAASMQAIADALDGNSGSDSLTIATANGSVTLNKSAVAAVAEQLGSGALELTMEGLAASDLNAAQTAALEGKEVEGGFTVALSSGGAPISDFGGGTAVLSFPFTPKAGAEAKDYRVYYAAPSGALARVPAAASNGVLHFRTSHFSDYVVVYEPQTNPFSDLTAAWYLDGALWAASNGVTNGMGDGRFLPDGACTRAQAVTFLWRMSGSPEPRSAANFADVPAGSWYAKAVAWAVENGVTNGMDGAFNPDGVVTRAQVVTMLCRLESGKATKEATFADAPRRQWYSDAIAWAVENGVANGMGGNLFGTDERCTRAQIVTFLYRDFVK